MRTLSTTAMPARHRRASGWLLAAASLAAAISIAACATRPAASPPPAPAPPELRVGIATNYPPLAFKQNGQITGAEAEFAGKLGPALRMRTTLVETPWEELIPALRDHRIDIIMSGMSITDARRQLVSFAHPYLRVGQMMLLRRADAKRLHDNHAVNQKSIRVGFVNHTTGETYVREHLPRAQPKGFESVDAAVAALRAHQIEVFIHDAPSIYRVTTDRAKPERELVGRYEPLTEEYLAWALRQDDDALRARVDAVLTGWNADGTLDAVLSKWIKVRRHPPRRK